MREFWGVLALSFFLALVQFAFTWAFNVVVGVAVMCLVASIYAVKLVWNDFEV